MGIASPSAPLLRIRPAPPLVAGGYQVVWTPFPCPASHNSLRLDHCLSVRSISMAIGGRRAAGTSHRRSPDGRDSGRAVRRCWTPHVGRASHAPSPQATTRQVRSAVIRAADRPDRPAPETRFVGTAKPPAQSRSLEATVALTTTEPVSDADLQRIRDHLGGLFHWTTQESDASVATAGRCPGHPGPDQTAPRGNAATATELTNWGLGWPAEPVEPPRRGQRWAERPQPRPPSSRPAGSAGPHIPASGPQTEGAQLDARAIRSAAMTTPRKGRPAAAARRRSRREPRLNEETKAALRRMEPLSYPPGRARRASHAARVDSDRLP